MDITVEVLETDLPATADTIICTVELGNSEVLTQRANLVEGGFPRPPVLKYSFKKICSHMSLAFTVSSQNQEDQQQEATTSSEATSSGKDVGYGLYPVTLDDPDNNQLDSPTTPTTNLTTTTHLVYLTKTHEHSHTANVQQVVGKLSFKIKFKPTKTSRRKEKGSWLSSKTVERWISRPALPGQVNLEELISREKNLTCTVPVPAEDPIVSVIFHSVSTKMVGMTSGDLLCLASIESSAEMKESSIFHDGEGKVCILPALKPIRLRSTGEGGQLTLNVADVKANRLLFNVSCPVAQLVPFQGSNWEYNWRCQHGPSGFNPAHSNSNVGPNVTVSLMRWPSISECHEYEGFEVFVNGVNFEEIMDFSNLNDRINLILGCRLVQVKGASDSPAMADKSGVKFPDSNIAVIKSSSEESTKSPGIFPGYFLFPGGSLDEGHQIELVFYVAKQHGTSPWWETNTKARAVITLSRATVKILPQPQYEEGVRWELADRAIANSSPEALVVRSAHGLLRWKSKRARFLSESNICKIPDLPLLSDIAIPEASSVHSDVSEAQSLQPTTDCNIALLTLAMEESAVSKLGQDIINLRKENALLRKENRDFERVILEKEESIMTLADQERLQLLTKKDLVCKVVELSQRLNAETEARTTFQSKVQRLQNTLIKKNEIESRYMELREAHFTQQNLVRELQRNVTKYKKCVETCQQQETVINQLEALLSSKRTVRKESGERAHLRTPLRAPTGLRQKSLNTDRRLDSGLAPRIRTADSTTSEHMVRKMEEKWKAATSEEKALMKELKEKATETLEYELELSHLKRRRSLKKQVERTRGASGVSIPHSIHSASQEDSAAVLPHGRRSPTAVPHHSSQHSSHHLSALSRHSTLAQHSQHSSQHVSAQRPPEIHSPRHSLQHSSQQHPSAQQYHPSAQHSSQHHTSSQHSLHRSASSRYLPRRPSLLSQHSLHSQLSSISETP